MKLQLAKPVKIAYYVVHTNASRIDQTEPRIGTVTRFDSLRAKRKPWTLSLWLFYVLCLFLDAVWIDRRQPQKQIRLNSRIASFHVTKSRKSNG